MTKIFPPWRPLATDPTTESGIHKLYDIENVILFLNSTPMLGGIQDGIGMECENLAFLLVYFDHVIEIPIGTAYIDSLYYFSLVAASLRASASTPSDFFEVDRRCLENSHLYVLNTL